MDYLWAPWRMPYLKAEHSPMEGCIFCEKINQPDAEEHILYRGETCFVMLNRYPYSNGHMMIVPYAHVPSVQALDDDVLLEMLHLVRECLCILRKVDQPHGFNIGVNEGRAAGAGIAEHVHLHIVPRWSGDANYMTVVGHTRVIPEGLDTTYARLKPHFENRE